MKPPQQNQGEIPGVTGLEVMVRGWEVHPVYLLERRLGAEEKVAVVELVTSFEMKTVYYLQRRISHDLIDG